MRILYIANIRLPTEKAHGLQIMKTCEALAEAGAEVELVVPTRRTLIKEDPFVYYHVRSLFALTRIRVPDLVRFGRPGFLLALLVFSERVRWLKSFWTVDIIYSRDALVLAQYMLLGRTFVFEAHAKPSLAARIVARRAHRVVVISRALRQAYVGIGVSPECIIVAPDAVDEHLFDAVPGKAEARKILGLPPARPTLVYAGHLYARKGADTLAQAAERLPEASFVFVGGTVEDMARFTKKWGAKENIHIVGHVPPERVPLYLRAADALVIPNSAKDEDTARFASPMKLFEYMASGTPIVASDVPSIREILGEEQAQFVAADDPVSLAGGVHALLADATRARERADAAQKRAAEYTWEKRAERILLSF